MTKRQPHNSVIMTLPRSHIVGDMEDSAKLLTKLLQKLGMEECRVFVNHSGRYTIQYSKNTRFFLFEESKADNSESILLNLVELSD